MDEYITVVLSRWEAEALLASATVARIHRYVQSPVLRGAEDKLAQRIRELTDHRIVPSKPAPRAQSAIRASYTSSTDQRLAIVSAS